jgi:hypothetical protein
MTFLHLFPGTGGADHLYLDHPRYDPDILIRTKFLYAQRELADIPAIIRSASLEACLDQIAARHLIALTKPFDLDDFLSTLEAALA